MPGQTYQEYINSLQGIGGKSSPFTSSPGLSSALKAGRAGKVEAVKFDVAQSAIYDRLNDGTYVPRFENYQGAVGNENRLAQQQSAGEQWLNGLIKNTRKMGNYVLDATVGTVYGAVSAISQGSLEGFWNNDFSKKMDDWNKQLDYKLPNYYSDERKSQSLLADIFSANFWANDVAGGLAFVGGAILPEIALGALTGGATIEAGLLKMGLRSGSKNVLKTAAREGFEEVFDPTNYAKKQKNIFGINTTKVDTAKLLDKAKDLEKFEGGVDILRQLNKTAFLSKVGAAADTGLFLARTSGFEAGMEARHNFKEAVDNFYNSFEERNGRQPTLEEATDFMRTATDSANGVFAANMAILGVSNAAMFGKFFNLKNPLAGTARDLGWGVKNFANSRIGLGLKAGEEVGELAIKQSTRAQRITGNVYKTLGKASVEGLWEEGGQGVIGRTMQNYLDAKYDANEDTSYSMMSAFSKAFGEQYGTKEGWKEIVIGGLIGWGAGAMQGGGFEGIGKNSRKAARVALQDKVNEVNRGVQTLRNMNRASSVQAFRNKVEEGLKNGNDASVEDAVMNASFIESQSHLKTPTQIKDDFNSIIDNMELDESAKSLLGDKVDAHKAELKDQFAKNMDSYQKAKTFVQGLNLKSSLPKETVGNVLEVEDALTMQLYVGQDALQNARKVAATIEQMTGSQGIFDAMEFYNNLNDENKTTVKELKKTRKTLEKLRQQTVELGLQQAEVKTGGRQFRPETAERRQKAKAEKLVMAQAKIVELTKREEELRNSLEISKKASEIGVADKMTEFSPDILGAVSELDKLNNYIKTLRAEGREYDAQSLENLVDQFKKYSDAHRETVNTIRELSSGNFFNTGKGKKTLRSIVGPKFVMSEDTAKVIRDNNEVMDAALRRMNIRGQESVDQVVKKMLEESTQYSEREKYKIENIVRMVLNVEALRRETEAAQKEVIALNTERVKAADPLEGDTVVLVESVKLKEEELNNVAALERTISSILTQIEHLRGGESTAKRVLDLQEKLRELNSKLNAAKEVEKQQQERNQQGNPVQPQGVGEGQQETGEGTGQQGQTSQQATDDSNSNQPGQTVKEIEEEIKAAEQDLAKAKASLAIVGQAELLRFQELTDKRTTENLSEELEEEYQELKADTDQWMFLTGVVADGMRLTDLILQHSIIKNTPINQAQSVENLESKDVIEGLEFGEKRGKVYYNMAQTYDAVTAVRTNKGFVELSGISPEEFAQEVGESFPFTVDPETNTILLDDRKDPTLLERINAETSLTILPKNSNLTTNYSTVLKHTDTGSGRLVSTFGATDFTDVMEPGAIYEMSPGDVVTLEIDPNDPYYDTIKEKGLDVAKTGVVRVKDKNGKFVGVLKSVRSKGTRTKEDENFVALRNKIFSDQAVLDALETGQKIEIPIEVTVAKTLIGHPNFNVEKNADGTVSTVNKPFTKKEAGKVLDMGYVEKGKLKTRGKTEGVDTTFLTKFIERGGEKRIPFVILKVGKKKIAYPVKVVEREKKDHKTFSDIYKAKAGAVDKVAALNRYLAENGIDISIPGNAFIAVGETNLNDNFFNNKLAQLNNLQYFYDLEAWTDGKVDKTEILTKQATIDINLSEPFHSPKLQLDYPDLVGKKGDTDGGAAAAQTHKTKEGTDTATKADDQTKTDC